MIHHVWLAVRPTPDIHAGCWTVICLAALNAMDKGRRSLFKVLKASEDQGTWIPTQILVDIACRAATAEFVGVLSDFAHLGLYRPNWVQQIRVLGDQHPFFRVLPGQDSITTHFS